MGAYFLFPIYYALFQGLEGLGLILAFRAYRRYYADDVIVPTSRITYDKFDDEHDGEDAKDFYHRGFSSGSDDSFYGRRGHSTQNIAQIPNNLPLAPEPPLDNWKQGQPKQAGDRTALISQNQPFASEYGGVDN